MNRWTARRARAWDGRQPWRVGCNFIPRTAVNQLETWQADSFDPVTIEQELAWAAELGMNLARVYLHDLAWVDDASGFKSRLDRFLQLAARQRIGTMPVIFDDCWNANPRAGQQPAPIPGVHNSGWLQSPGAAAVNDPGSWPRLERYVRDLLDSFGQDDRIFAWDLYNEPGNSQQAERSLPFLRAAFKWARAAAPEQPLTSGLWSANVDVSAFQAGASDIISFHNYENDAHLGEQIAHLRGYNRPLLCTEWLRRGHSDVAACLPIFQREGVHCCNWGLVAGKTQTIYPWGSVGGEPEPAVWFHDLLRPDGLPFDPEEIRLFRSLTRAGRRRGASGGVDRVPPRR